MTSSTQFVMYLAYVFQFNILIYWHTNVCVHRQTNGSYSIILHTVLLLITADRVSVNTQFSWMATWIPSLASAEVSQVFCWPWKESLCGNSVGMFVLSLPTSSVWVLFTWLLTATKACVFLLLSLLNPSLSLCEINFFLAGTFPVKAQEDAAVCMRTPHIWPATDFMISLPEVSAFASHRILIPRIKCMLWGNTA